MRGMRARPARGTDLACAKKGFSMPMAENSNPGTRITANPPNAVKNPRAMSVPFESTDIEKPKTIADRHEVEDED